MDDRVQINEEKNALRLRIRNGVWHKFTIEHIIDCYAGITSGFRGLLVYRTNIGDVFTGEYLICGNTITYQPSVLRKGL